MDIISSLLVGFAQALCQTMNTTDTRGGHKPDLEEAKSDLETATSELKAIRDDLVLRINRNGAAGRRCTTHAEAWLEAVGKAEEKAESIIARCMCPEPRKGIRRRCLSCVGCADYKLIKTVLVALKNVNELIQRSKEIETDGGPIQEACREIPINPVVGITTMKERVLEFLSDEEKGIIGIYGPGGVGKTTLMQSINNELISRGHQDNVLMIWVTMSRHFGECTIQKAVGAQLGLTWGETDTGEDRAGKISTELKKRQFLLFLDDVWEEISFEKTGIPPPDKENKCKVMFTTRSKALCSKMGAERNMRVEFLEKQYAWELFCNKVGRRDLLESPLIRRHAETIVNKCGGLPLALITLGSAMAHRDTEEEWIHASEVLNKFPAEMTGMEHVFALLKYSYDNLESDLLQVCFLYCALFPEEHSIEIEQLVAYWLGEGFLTSSHSINMLYKGYFLIGDLKAACLLETGDETTQVKMHNVVRSFALWMASEQNNKELVLVEPRMGLTEAPKTENWRHAVAISLMDNRIQTLPEEPICPKLTTLMLQQNIYLRRIPADFFINMPLLRVLDLSFTKITKIPESIKYLVELHHLTLSGTNIRVLPHELVHLKKLRHLDLHRNQYLQTIPTNAICQLSKLEVLNLYYSYVGWELKSLGGPIKELGFADLKHLNNLTTLGITVRSLCTLNTFYEFKAVHECIQHLHVDKCDDLLYFDLSSLSNHGGNLRRLSITNCKDLEFMVRPTDVVDCLPSLEVLTLRSLQKLSSVWRNPVNQECLRNIRCINISQCHKLKNISWVLQLPKLETIVLLDCRELEELISDHESPSIEDPVLFPSLKNLSIKDLPELSSILPSRFSFQKLENLVILNCPKVKKLPFQERVQTNLPVVYCDEKWWEALEQDQPITELCCSPRFVPN